MAPIKSVAIVGGTGDLGSKIVEQVVAAGLFDVALITRNGKTSQAPPGVRIITSDYESSDSLAEVLRGFDALISVVPGHLTDLQFLLIDAAVTAGVRRFIPSEFGSDHRLPAAKEIPLSAGKIKVHNLIQEKASQGVLEYTSIIGGPWIEWIMGADDCMSVPKRRFTIHDDGQLEFGLTTRKAFGDAVAGVLKHPDETKNKVLGIEVIRLTQNRIVELAKEVFPGETFELVHVNTLERYQRGVEKMISGQFDPSVIADIVLRFVFDPKLHVPSDVKETNELLGVKNLTEQDFKEIIKSGPLVN